MSRPRAGNGAGAVPGASPLADSGLPAKSADEKERRRLLTWMATCSLAWFSVPVRGQGMGGKTHDAVSITDFQNAAEGDWTAALNQATAVARRVYIPPGEYLLRSADWPSDTEIFGAGDSSILRMPADAAYLITTDSGSPATEKNIVGLSMHDLQLRASCDVDGFSEFKHLLSLNGVTGVRIARVLFKGFRGDGLYLGSGNIAGSERHNRDVVVEACRFDGINRENRNGITAIDCDGLLVQDCRFFNLTAAKMPGAIDLEPNKHAFHVIRGVTIRRNRFSKVGGNLGVVGVFVPASVAVPPRDITVADNVSDNYVGTGAFFSYSDNRAPTADGPANLVRITGNTARAGVMPFMISSGSGIEVRSNVFSGFTQTAYIGYDGARTRVRDLVISDNLMERCGTANRSALAVFNVENARFTGNRFVDSASKAGAGASAIDFRRGRSSGIVFERNEFVSSVGGSVAIRKDAGHAFSPQTNRFADNRLNGMQHFFETEVP